MLNSQNLKLYLIISLLGLGVIASDIALIIQNQSLRNSSSTISELKEQNKTLQAKLKEGPAQQQPAEEAKTQEEFNQLRASIQKKTYEALDKRISEAKTDSEKEIFNKMKQKYDNIFNLSDKFRTAQGDEKTKIRNSIAEEWIALGQLYQDYDDYQWKSLAEEFGITDTDKFVKRADEIQAGFNKGGNEPPK